MKDRQFTKASVLCSKSIETIDTNEKILASMTSTYTSQVFKFHRYGSIDRNENSNEIEIFKSTQHARASDITKVEGVKVQDNERESIEKNFIKFLLLQ